MSREPEYVWVAYGKDRARLPIAVADTAAELARLVGTTRNRKPQRCGVGCSGGASING